MGVVSAPLLFAWLTLRRGYSRDLRKGAFLLMTMWAIMGIIHIAARR